MERKANTINLLGMGDKDSEQVVRVMSAMARS